MYELWGMLLLVVYSHWINLLQAVNCSFTVEGALQLALQRFKITSIEAIVEK